jgi:integrase
MEQLQQANETYKNFIYSINSNITRLEYNRNFSYFMTFCKITNHEDMIMLKPQILEGLIHDYVIHLRHERNLSPATVSSYLAPITHFYEMNDVIIKWKKPKKFKAKHYNIIEDKPYTREQIKTLVDAAPLRDKCIILIMCSAGLRRGAIQHLRIRDLTKISKYQLYKINVYKKRTGKLYHVLSTGMCSPYRPVSRLAAAIRRTAPV